MKNKRGLSNIIATVVIVLLVLVSVGVVWKYILPIIQGNSEGIISTAKCLGLDLEILDAVYDDGVSPPALTVIVKRNTGGGELTKIKFIVDGETLPDGDASDLDELETKTFEITDFGTGESAVTPEINDNLQIVPVIETNSKEVTCANTNIKPFTIRSD